MILHTERFCETQCASITYSVLFKLGKILFSINLFTNNLKFLSSYCPIYLNVTSSLCMSIPSSLCSRFIWRPSPRTPLPVGWSCRSPPQMPTSVPTHRFPTSCTGPDQSTSASTLRQVFIRLSMCMSVTCPDEPFVKQEVFIYNCVCPCYAYCITFWSCVVWHPHPTGPQRG